jgi:hypothetical protein
LNHESGTDQTDTDGVVGVTTGFQGSIDKNHIVFKYAPRSLSMTEESDSSWHTLGKEWECEEGQPRDNCKVLGSGQARHLVNCSRKLLDYWDEKLVDVVENW